MLSKSSIIPSVETLQTILNSIPSPVFLIDREHRIVMGNDAFFNFTQTTPDEVLNTVGQVPAEQHAVFWKVDDEVFETGEPNENEEVATDRSGTPHIVLTRKRLIHLPTKDGVTPFIIAVISDVTRIREAEARARYLAGHDALTGLANRAQLNERLSESIELARRSNSKVGLLLLDLDGFKAVNDQHGHAAGDELLRVIAKRLNSHVRVVDTVARLGGDEFCVIQVGVQQPSGAFVLAERLVNALEQPVVMGSAKFSVTASIGVALYPDDSVDPEELYKGADAALYHVKRSGGGGYLRSGASGPMSREAPWKMEEGLRHALAEDEFTLTYAPLSGTDGQPHGYEALLVWKHPERGEIARELFLPVADKAGLLREVSVWTLRHACLAAAEWDGEMRVSVNVFPVQLEYGDLVETVEQVLADTGLSPHRLELEMPETALVGDEERVGTILGGLRQLGVHLTLDNFGSGTSSMAHLRKFPFDRIKIDQSFIASLATDPRSVAIVSAILHLGEEMNVAIAAEGVDDERQLLMLREMGVEELQGRLLGEPATHPKGC